VFHHGLSSFVFGPVVQHAQAVGLGGGFIQAAFDVATVANAVGRFGQAKRGADTVPAFGKGQAVAPETVLYLPVSAVFFIHRSVGTQFFAHRADVDVFVGVVFEVFFSEAFFLGFIVLIGIGHVGDDPVVFAFLEFGAVVIALVGQHF